MLQGCDFTTGVSRRILKAQTYVDEYQYQEALNEYHELIKLNIPENIEHKIYFQMAEIYGLYLNDSTNALKFYKKVNDQFADEKFKSIALKKSAKICFELKNYSEAITYYKKFIQNDNFTELEKKYYQMQIAISYYEMSQYTMAEKYFKKIGLDENNYYQASAYFYLGQIASYKNQSEEAIDYWRKSIELEKIEDKKVDTIFYLANHYEREYNLEKAYEYYYSILSTYHNPELIKKRLEAVYQRKVSRRR